MFTCRVEVTGLEAFIHKAQNSKCILILWHHQLVIIPEIIRKNASQFTYKAFISKSQDADPLAIVSNSYACGGVIRVSHDARHLALNQMIMHLKEHSDILIVTPDGPRGPCRRAKPGIVIAAKHSGASIIPMSWMATRYWQVNTWDKLVIPKPFSKIHFIFGTSIAVNSDADVEERVRYIEDVMRQMTGDML